MAPSGASSATSRAVALVAAVLMAACASTPQAPRLAIGQLQAEVQSSGIKLETLETAGRGRNAATGAARGGGIGLTWGALACAATGPMVGLCLATVVPTSLALGATLGATVGAIRGEDADSLAAKRQLLGDMAQAAPHWPLAAQWRALSAEAEAPAAAAATDTAWTLRLSWTSLNTVGRGQPHALGMGLRAELLKPGSHEATWSKDYAATGTLRQDTAAWAEAQAAAAHQELRQLSQSLLLQLVADLGGER